LWPAAASKSLLPKWQQELRDALLAARGLIMHWMKKKKLSAAGFG